MRRIVWLLLIAGILWSAWWGVTAFGIRTGIYTWFEERRTEGWQAELADVGLSGWPLNVTADIAAPALADPGTPLPDAHDIPSRSKSIVANGDTPPHNRRRSQRTGLYRGFKVRFVGGKRILCRKALEAKHLAERGDPTGGLSMQLPRSTTMA